MLQIAHEARPGDGAAQRVLRPAIAAQRNRLGPQAQSRAPFSGPETFNAALPYRAMPSGPSLTGKRLIAPMNSPTKRVAGCQ